MVLLSLSASAVDAGGGLGRITTHESVCRGYEVGRKGGNDREKRAPLLVEEEDIATALEKGMCGREASKTATYYDYLCHGSMG
jgi:hypothetical protein